MALREPSNPSHPCRRPAWQESQKSFGNHGFRCYQQAGDADDRYAILRSVAGGTTCEIPSELSTMLPIKSW